MDNIDITMEQAIDLLRKESECQKEQHECLEDCENCSLYVDYPSLVDAMRFVVDCYDKNHVL